MNKLLSLVCITLLIVSCGKNLETVTVQSNPLEPVEFEADSAVSKGDDTFRQITIGETGLIESLDPLFADNSSELRIINLLYDGLISIDRNGEVTPAIAVRWDVNEDSTRYIFHLRPEIQFHDSQVFSGGVGRQLTAQDVQFVFERMASSAVPNTAATFFKEIRGFSEYHHEQTYIKNPAKRVLESISGINVTNDSTLTIYLEKNSPDFLKKLAHPMASVYARESTTEAMPPIHEAAGTGPFYFIKKENDRFILGINDRYYLKSPDIDRLDILFGLSEKDMFQQFARNEIDVIMEPGPALLTTVADSSGNLSTSYNGAFNLTDTGVLNEFHFFYNPTSEAGNISDLLQDLDIDSFRKVNGVTDVNLTLPKEDSPSTDSLSSVTFAHTTHPVETYMINQFAQQATAHGVNVILNPSYSVTENVQFSTKPFAGAQSVLKWNSKVYYLSQKGISGIEIIHKPWNLDLTNIQTQDSQ